MRSELIIDLMQHLGGQLKFVVNHAPLDVERELESLAVPMDVKRLLQWHWPRTSVAVGPYTLIPAEQILTSHDLDGLLAGSMVPVGYAVNGDILVLRFVDGRDEIGLVSHDKLWEEEASAAEAYVGVCRSVDDYLYRVSEGRYLPRDAFAAEEWQALLRESARGGPTSG